MQTTISIPVEPELAEIYAASEETQQKIQVLVKLWLREKAASNRMPLSELMDSISDKAEARGMTPEILETLLRDDE